MTDNDLNYVQHAIAAKQISSPVLELGTGFGPTCKQLIEAEGYSYIGSDLAPGPNVDVVADLECAEQLERFSQYGPIGTALVLNVLEHTFDPIRVLDNIVSLVRPGGTVICVTPAIWPLHNYPMDAWRLLPNFYEEYALRRGLQIVPEFFEYVGREKVNAARTEDGSYRFPLPYTSGFQRWRSRIVHRAFRTFGRGVLQPTHVAIGCTFTVSPDSITAGYASVTNRNS